MRYSRVHSLVPALLLVLPVSVALCGCVLAKNYPSDDAIRQLFNEHRDAFEKLAELTVDDGANSTFMLAQAWCSGPLPANRQKQYRALMKSIDNEMVIRTDSVLISFAVWGGGEGLSVNRSWFKGLAYFPGEIRPGAQVVPQLNTRPEDDGTYIVPIGGKWYIVYDQS